MMIQDDAFYMRQALLEAEKALALNEVPIGAIIVTNGKIIARAHNLTERLTDFTAHAEMQAFTSAANYLQNKYLDKCTLYVTLEPCAMCMGAAFWTRIGRIVYGATDEKRGISGLRNQLVHPNTAIDGGILALESSALLSHFFAQKRKKK